MGFTFCTAWLNTSSGSLPLFDLIVSKASYTICSATDFLPRVMRTLTNFATSALPYFGSGKISRLGTSLRRGMETFRNSGGFGFLRAVLGSALLAVFDALGIERAAHDVVAHARQVFHPASPDQHHGVLLQVVAFPADVADHLEPVGKAHFGDLAQSRVRLLGRRRVDARAHAALLRRAGKRGNLALGGQASTRIAYQLVDCRHYFVSKKDRDGPSVRNGRPEQFKRPAILAGKAVNGQQVISLGNASASLPIPGSMGHAS